MNRVLPLIGFALLLCLFGFGIWWNTRHDQREVPSPLIGKPAPAYQIGRASCRERVSSPV